MESEPLEKLSQRIADLENQERLHAEDRALLDELKADRAKAQEAAKALPAAPPPAPARDDSTAAPVRMKHPWLE